MATNTRAATAAGQGLDGGAGQSLTLTPLSSPKSTARGWRSPEACLGFDEGTLQRELVAARLSSWLAVEDRTIDATPIRALERLGDDLVADRPELALRAWERAAALWEVLQQERRGARVRKKLAAHRV